MSLSFTLNMYPRFMGCWRASGDHLVSTASLLLLAFLCGGAGMGLWHGARFYEMEKVFTIITKSGFLIEWGFFTDNLD